MATITKIQNKSGVSWRGQIRIRRNGKIVYSQTYTHAKKAYVEAWAKRRETELAVPGVLDQLQHRGIKVGAVLDWYKTFSEHAAGRSKLAQIKFLEGSPIADLDAIALTSGDVVDFARSRRAAGVAASTAGQDITWLRLAFNAYRLSTGAPVAVQAIEDAAGLLRQSRVIGRPQQRERRPSLDELNSLLDFFVERDERSKIQMVDVVLFALFSGRREDEICRIAWSNLDSRRRAVLVPLMKHPRGVRDTWVFLTDEAWAIIQRQAKDKEDDRIFRYNSKSVGSAFTKACHFLEIEDLRFHDLRHECTSWLFECGWDIPRVAGVTGHKSWSSLQRYTHLKEGKPHDKYKRWKWRPKKKR